MDGLCSFPEDGAAKARGRVPEHVASVMEDLARLRQRRAGGVKVTEEGPKDGPDQAGAKHNISYEVGWERAARDPLAIVAHYGGHDGGHDNISPEGSAGVHECISADPQVLSLTFAWGVVGRAREGLVVWVGRGCWVMQSAARSMYVQTRGGSEGLVERVWAAEQAVRSGVCALVVADGSGFTRSHTQRLQLAVKERGTPCLLLRPARDVKTATAAATRWLAVPVADITLHRDDQGNTATGWAVSLLRCKGRRPLRTEWLFTYVHHHTPVHLRVSAFPQGGSAEATGREALRA